VLRCNCSATCAQFSWGKLVTVYTVPTPIYE
jgi:hypothetical protein